VPWGSAARVSGLALAVRPAGAALSSGVHGRPQARRAQRDAQHSLDRRNGPVTCAAPGLSGCSHQPGHETAQAQSAVAPVCVSAAELARLPRATTFTRIPAAPLDQTPFALTGGLVVHPLEPQVLYAAPGKQPVAVLPATELGGPTWVKRHPDRPARSAKRLASDAGSEPGSEPLGECGLVILAQTRNGQRMGEKSAATAG